MTAYIMVKKSSMAPACCIWWKRSFLADFPCKRKRQWQQKRKQQQQKM